MVLYGWDWLLWNRVFRLLSWLEQKLSVSLDANQVLVPDAELKLQIQDGLSNHPCCAFLVAT